MYLKRQSSNEVCVSAIH